MCRSGQRDGDVLCRQFLIELAQLLAEYQLCHMLIHVVEDHGVRKTVDKLRLEGLLHLREHRLATAHTSTEANACLRGILRSSIRSHNEDDVAEVSLLSLVVSQSGVVHHLQEDVVDVAVRLLYLVEEEHAVRGLADGIGQETAVLIAHVSGRRTDELCHGMLLGVFAHVEANQLDAEFLGEHTSHLGLAHSRRSHKQERSQWLVIVHESCLRHHHSLNHLIHRLVLTVNLVEHVLTQMSQSLVVIVLDGGSVYLANLGEDLLDNRLGDIRTLAILHRMHFQVSTRLIHQVDSLVGQTAVADILGAGTHAIFQGILTISHVMELVVLILQALQYLDGLLLGRFLDVYLLESAHDALALGDVAVVFLVGGGADESDVASLQVLLEHVGSIWSAIRTTTGTYHIVNLVEIDDAVALLGGTLHHCLDAFLEVATILGTSQHLGDIHAVDASTLQSLRHLTVVDELGETIYQGCLAHTRLADVQRIVFLGTTKHLDGAIEFLLSADERIVLLHLVGDAGYELMPVLRLATSALLIVVIIIIVIIIIIKIATDAHVSLSRITFQRIETIHTGEKLALSVAHSLAQQVSRLGVLQSQHRLYEVRHVDEFSIGGSGKGASRTKHGLEERGRLGQILHGRRHTLLLGEPPHQVLVHLQAIHPFLLERLTEAVLTKQRQEQMLRHDKLVVEEPSLLHRIIHQDVHISG